MTEQQEKEIKVFGTTIEHIEDSIQNFDGKISFAFSVLSDSQELIGMGDHESARQHINIAKYLLGDVLDDEKVKKYGPEYSRLYGRDKK